MIEKCYPSRIRAHAVTALEPPDPTAPASIHSRGHLFIISPFVSAGKHFVKSARLDKCLVLQGVLSCAVYCGPMTTEPAG